MKPFYNQGWVGMNIQPHVEYFAAQTFSHLWLDWKHHMGFDPKPFCPSGIERSSGNSAKGQKKSCWKPQIRFAQVVLLVGTRAQRPDFKPLLGFL